ncbi:MAG TPA: orotate phosphoribosyltransferase [Bacteroidales bacterium]|nr:orotate phosphoribosyltransferase [Bacteroidales bacterium]
MEYLEQKIAQSLLQIKAIKLQPANPFTWASGWKSPIYCDNRKTLSYPEVRDFIKESFAQVVTEKFGQPDFIAGVATGAIAIGALVADTLNLPFVYVRPKPKEHGLGNQIEGVISEKKKVVVIEDLISTGKSSLKAIEALRNENIEVLGMVAIFTYGFKIAEDNFKNANISLATLSNYNQLIQFALETGYIKESDIKTLNQWRDNPEVWGK